VDQRNATVVEAKYDQAWDLVQGVARVKSGDLFGAIDSTGKEVLALTYLSLTDSQFGYFVVGTEAGLGVADHIGKIIIAPQFTAVEMINPRIARVERNERFGYVRLADAAFIWKEEAFDKPVAPSAQ